MSKKAKQTAGAEDGSAGGRPGFRVALADSPRASASVRRAKARGGLLGFGLAALAAWMHGGAPVDVLLRGLEGGVAAYVVCWFAAVTAWRHLIRAEVRAAIAHAERRRDTLRAELAATRASE